MSSSAVPLHEEGQISFVVVTFRDITDRILLEEQLQVQADTSQTLADAGASSFFNLSQATRLARPTMIAIVRMALLTV